MRGLLIPVSAAVLAALVAWMGYRAYNVELSPLPPEERVTDSGGAEPGALAQRQPAPVFDDTDSRRTSSLTRSGSTTDSI